MKLAETPAARRADLEGLESALANVPDSVDRMIMEDGSAVPPADR